MATLSDVAALAGVSVSAVSRVLSDAPAARVSVATRQRILDAAHQLGYRPNFAARALKSSRTDVIGLVVPDLTNAIFTELMRGVEDEALGRQYLVLLAREETMPGLEWIDRLVGEGRVDGVIVQVGDEIARARLDALINGSTPVVLVNSSRGGRASSVALPDELAVRLAVEHLVSLGHRRIGLLNGSPQSDTAARRGRGFVAAMSEAGLEVDSTLVTALGYTVEQGREALRAVLDAGQPPSAVVVANVNAGFGVLIEARVRGVAVPEGLSVVAIHDVWTADSTWPPLTTVRMPLYELGRAAVGALSDLLRGGDPVDLLVSEPSPILIRRESTAPPA